MWLNDYFKLICSCISLGYDIVLIWCTNAVYTLGAVHLTKILVWNFGNSTCPIEQYIPVAQTQPKPPHIWLLFLWAGYKRAVLGTTVLSSGKGHFGPTDQNDKLVKEGRLQSWSWIFWLDQIKIVLSINWCTNWNLRNFGLNGKRTCSLIYLFRFLKSCFNVTSRKVNIKLW